MTPGIVDWFRKLMFWRRKKAEKPAEAQRKQARPKKTKQPIIKKRKKVKRMRKAKIRKVKVKKIKKAKKIRKPVKVKPKKIIVKEETFVPQRIEIENFIQKRAKIPARKPTKPLSAEIPKTGLSKILQPITAKEKIPKKLKEVIKEAIVSDVMGKDVFCVNTSDTLSYVVRLFTDKKISGAPVVKGDSFVGVLTESDILKYIEGRDLLKLDSFGLKKLKEIKVEQVMHKNPISVFENTRLSEAADLMNKYDISRLPVLNEKRDIVGILTRSDIIRGVSKELLYRILKKRPGEEVWLRKVQTDVDEILRIVDRRGSISMNEIHQKLTIPEDKIEEWGKILEKHNLVEMYYPPIGKPEFRKKPLIA